MSGLFHLAECQALGSVASFLFGCWFSPTQAAKWTDPGPQPLILSNPRVLLGTPFIDAPPIPASGQGINRFAQVTQPPPRHPASLCRENCRLEGQMEEPGLMETTSLPGCPELNEEEPGKIRRNVCEIPQREVASQGKGSRAEPCDLVCQEVCQGCGFSLSLSLSSF